MAKDPRSEVTILERARALVQSGTTELADDVLRVPISWYRDPGLFERERDLLRRTPLALVESARLRAPHDFVVREVLGASLLVVRDGEGVVRAFLNHCRHRGARPADGCGNARRFACPYHGWTYDSAGKLVGIPGASGFPGIDPDAYGLPELPSEERHGLVWVVLETELGIDLDAHLGPLDGEMAAWGLERHEHFAEREFSSPVSWKAALEAFAENYHFPYVHGGSLVGRNIVANTTTFEQLGRHHRLGFPNPWITTVPEGAPDLHGVSLIHWIFPNLVVALSAVGVEMIEILPGADPSACVVRHAWMAADPAGGDAEKRAGYEALFETVHRAVRDEDFAMLPQCGSTIRAAQHDHMLVGRNEIGVQHVVRTLAGALGVDLC